MTCLSQRPAREWEDNVNVQVWMKAVTADANLVSNGFVLEGLVRLVRAA